MTPAVKLSLRLDFTRGRSTQRLGPGKVELMEHIATLGSLAAAARAMDMSYKRAWALLAMLNAMFDEPVAVTLPGRNQEGSTQLTPFGARVVALYRAAERRSQQAAAAAIEELAAAAQPKRVATPARRSLPRRRAA